MKRGTAALTGVLLAGVAWMQPAAAQGLPQGSYLSSCMGAALRGDTLVATCRRADGREQRTSLADVRRCVGDIGNNNGNLQCNYGGGRGPKGGCARCGSRKSAWAAAVDTDHISQRLLRCFGPAPSRIHVVRARLRRRGSASRFAELASSATPGQRERRISDC